MRFRPWERTIRMLVRDRKAPMFVFIEVVLEENVSYGLVAKMSKSLKFMFY